MLMDGLNKAYLVFFMFRDNLFAQNQSFSLTSSLRFACDIYKVVSSAKERIDRLVQYLMSFMQTRKRIGPKIDPCGTPQITFNIKERI